MYEIVLCDSRASGIQYIYVVIVIYFMSDNVTAVNKSGRSRRKRKWRRRRWRGEEEVEEDNNDSDFYNSNRNNVD